MAETPLPSPPRGRCPSLLEQNIDLENQQSHQPTSPLPIWEGRGDRSSRRADHYVYLGEVPTLRSIVRIGTESLAMQA